jgi:flagellar basal-body rod protein FlgB
MFESLDLFRTSGALMRHAAQRQAQAAVNVAQADTPGYRARMLPSFAEAMGEGGLRATRPGHLGQPPASRARPVDAGGEAAPNGNTVSLEREMFASVQASREHNQALAVWRHAVTVLRASLGGR